MALKVPDLDRSVPMVEDNRTPTYTFHVWWQTVVKKLKEAFADIEAALAAAGIALEAAEDAQDAADAADAAAAAAQAAADAVQDQVDNLVIPPAGSRTITANDSSTQDDSTILVDATAGNITLSLHSATSFLSPLVVTKIDASVNTVSIVPTGGDSLNGGGGGITLTTQYETRTFVADGTSEWYA